MPGSTGLEVRAFKFPDTLCGYLGRTVKEALAASLAEDMKKNGQLHAGCVAPDPDHPGRFLIILGNHRHRACQIAGLEFRAEVLPAMPHERERIQMQVSENLKRRALDAFDRAMFIADYKATLPPGATWAEVADGLGMKEATVLLHVAPRRIPESLRPSCDGLGLTVLCLIGRTPKIGDMPKVIEFARDGATKSQIEAFIKRPARTPVGRKPKWGEGRINGRLIRYEIRHGEKGHHFSVDLDEAAKKFRKYGDGDLDGLGFVLA